MLLAYTHLGKNAYPPGSCLEASCYHPIFSGSNSIPSMELSGLWLPIFPHALWPQLPSLLAQKQVAPSARTSQVPLSYCSHGNSELWPPGFKSTSSSGAAGSQPPPCPPGDLCHCQRKTPAQLAWGKPAATPAADNWSGGRRKAGTVPLPWEQLPESSAPRIPCFLPLPARVRCFHPAMRSVHKPAISARTRLRQSRAASPAPPPTSIQGVSRSHLHGHQEGGP